MFSWTHVLYSWLHDAEWSIPGTIQLAEALKCRAPTTLLTAVVTLGQLRLSETGSKCNTEEEDGKRKWSHPLRCPPSSQALSEAWTSRARGFLQNILQRQWLSTTPKTPMLFWVIYKPFWEVPRTRAPNKCSTVLSQTKYVKIYWVSYLSN